MASIEEIREERLKKIAILRDKGIDPYPISSSPDVSVEKLVLNFSKLSKRKKPLKLVGRVKALRGQGALIFLDFSDGTGMFQGLLKKGEMKEDLRELFIATVDIGDFIELKGTLFTTKRKEKTLLVKDWRMLAKSLRPLPDKWHGLKDVEERFRRRYLDTLMSPEVKERFMVRSKMITELRSFLGKEGFLEVETPILQPSPGGATAEPFSTHHDALNMGLYLRIAPELYLKRLLVGGFDKVYEIGRNFRNEGIDVTHNPEFTMLEFYESFSDAKKQMAFVEKMIRSAVKKLFKKSTIAHNGKNIDFSKKFTVVSFFDLLKRYALISHPENMDKNEITLKAKQLGIDVDEADTVEKTMDSIYKKVCRPKLIQPTFIVGYPANYLPLAKRLPKDATLVDAFQLVIGGIELAKGFSELNDPIDQLERFAQQEARREAGDKEAHGADREFLEAMEYGMPPAGGVGIGIDRLAMLLTDTHNIREVILFPTLRPRSDL
ncbi:MAG: lysine--tRNA ligase [Patescibacteria group bacterium]|nr:MAG: lysine--tRNA ligase [Patescibacteria group bacterium]